MKRAIVRLAFAVVSVATFFVAPAGAQTPAVKPAPSAKPAAFNASACLGCHAPVKALYDSGKHKAVGCNSCHDGTAAHLADASKRPTTKTDLANCGGCHENQYNSYAQMDWQRPARFEKKQTTGPAPDPAYDLLMSPHGFTKEHNLPRGHTFALLDQFVVDRAFGGRFGTQESWRYLAGTGDFKVWDRAVDLYPDNTEQKVFKPGTAAAANPVCLSCKTQDHILEWAYMGDPVPNAKWSRTSKARPGARGESMDTYVKRLEDLQAIAESFGGVEKSFAVQAGREVRILVRPEEIDDLTASRLARDIVKKIEEQLTYPGQIKVTVIRETRAVEYAK